MLRFFRNRCTAKNRLIKIDFTLVTNEGEVLGYFEGIMNLEKLPKKNEKVFLFKPTPPNTNNVIDEYLKQPLTVEHRRRFYRNKSDNAEGILLLSFFYIPHQSLKDDFVKFFEDNYDFFFNDFSI